MGELTSDENMYFTELNLLYNIVLVHPVHFYPT
jgi:hypothetical protein